MWEGPKAKRRVAMFFCEILEILSKRNINVLT